MPSAKRKRPDPLGPGLNHASRLALLDVRFERESFGFTQPLEDRLERREHRRRHASDWAERHADGAARTLRPIGHVEASDKATDQLTALIEQLARSLVELLDGNEEIARHEMTIHIAPGGVADRAAFGPAS